MQYSYCKILLCCLILQVAVDATDIFVLSPIYVPRGGSSNLVVATFTGRDATVIDSFIAGQLEMAAPSDACAPIASPSFVPYYYRRNMVLINGTDECDFMTKVKNARAVGFEAAILFDPFPGPFNYSNITFPIERSEIDITVVLVSLEDGIKLKGYLYPESKKTDYFVQIGTGDYPIVVYFFYACVAVFGAAIVVFGAYGLFLKLKRYRRGRANVTNWNIQPASGESESAHLLAPESSVPDDRPHPTEKLKNDLVEALGSVNSVERSDLERENTKTVIV